MAQTQHPLHRNAAAAGRSAAAPANGPRRGPAALARAVVSAVAVVVALGGCAYRVNIQQGNVVEQDAVEQVEEGMTRSQVRFLLGTPLVADPFHTDRWDYTYYFRRGREDDVQRRWISVHFDGDRVTRIEERIARDGEPVTADERESLPEDLPEGIDTEAAETS